MKAPVIHFEILGNDGEKLKEFYKNLFNWKIDSSNPMNYGMVKKEGKGIGGGIASVQTGNPPKVTIYIAVENVTERLKKVEELGGKIIMPETVVPNVVTLGLFADPEGNIIGLVKNEMPKKKL
jgi:uncharacterized protein